MTDQTTATDQPTTTEQEPTADQRAAPNAQPGATPAAPDAEPTGTPALRDAQASHERAQTEGRSRRAQSPASQPRPAIRAVDGGGSTERSTERRQNAALFDEAAGKRFQDRWLTIQTEFVDEPRDAVQKADGLVAEVLKQLTDTFAHEREELEAGWSGAADGSDQEISTEDLRQAIQRYRSFFNRLLAL